MRNICFYFQVHQPFRLKRYRFFDIGDDHHYFDEYANKSIMRKVAEKSYLPTNKLLLDLIRKHDGKFKISYSISGTAIKQFEQYAPDVLESFVELANTGHVEFLAETFSHSLAALKSKDEFQRQVKLHVSLIEKYFGQTPSVFRNTELIYSDEIGEMVAEMGYKAILTEGAKHVLGWKSPNYLYYNDRNPKLKVLLKNFKLSDDIAFRFSNQSWEDWPLTTDKYVDWLNQIDQKEEIINLFMDYETFGEHQWEDSGIFEFLKILPDTVFNNSNFGFATASEVANNHAPIAAYQVPFPISWADEERDLTTWLGNELQDEAFDKLYALEGLVRQIDDEQIQQDWLYLQTSDHFYYMCTKFFSDGDVHMYFNPYNTPYDAFINFMNALSDFILRIEERTQSLDPAQKISIAGFSNSQIKDLIKKHEVEIEKLKILMKPEAIEKTKKVSKAIAKTKKKAIPISKTKKKATPIAKTKKQPKAIDKK